MFMPQALFLSRQARFLPLARAQAIIVAPIVYQRSDDEVFSFYDAAIFAVGFCEC